MKLPDLPSVDPKAVPRDPPARATWITIQLRKRGLSFRKLSMRDGYSENYYSQCLLRPLFPAEQAVAEALGITSAQLFVERFDRQGNRLHHIMAKNSRRCGPRESQIGDAA